MNRIRRSAALLAGLACAWLGLAAAAPAAFARVPHSSQLGAPPAPVPARIVVMGGMPGWQIALIAAGAALLAATVAVLADRAWAARRTAVSTAA